MREPFLERNQLHILIVGALHYTILLFVLTLCRSNQVISCTCPTECNPAERLCHRFGFYTAVSPSQLRV